MQERNIFLENVFRSFLNNISWRRTYSDIIEYLNYNLNVFFQTHLLLLMQFYMRIRLIQKQAWGLQLYLKRDSGTGVFSCEFCEIFQNTSGRLLLPLWKRVNSTVAADSVLQKLKNATLWQWDRWLFTGWSWGSQTVKDKKFLIFVSDLT